MTKRVAMYLRVSTSGQTVENQRRDLDAVGTVGSSNFTAQMPAEIKVEPDDTVSVPLDLSKVHLFDKQTGQTILDGPSSDDKIIGKNH